MKQVQTTMKKSKLQIKLLKAGISQIEIAKLAGVTPKAVSLVVKGQGTSAKITEIINRLLSDKAS